MIEDIQKVNKLAQELLDQGVASEREEAVKKAQEMLNKDISQTQTINSENKIEVDKKGDGGLEYYKNIISRTKEQMERQLAAFTEKINEMIKEINEIKEQIKTRAISKSASETNIEQDKPIKEAVEETKEAEHSKPEKQQELKKPEPHPKRGNLTSEDVSIEKMFYFGNK